jgi:YfiH family protein
MIVHKKFLYAFVFGTAQEGCDPSILRGLTSNQLPAEPCEKIKKTLDASDIFFLHQTHSDTGKIISSREDVQQPILVQEGDYLITNIPGIALGVLTADCLPVILYDPICKALGVVHAGWRGSVQEISVKALCVMRDTFGVKPETVEVFFGPAARSCCYEIQDDVMQHLGSYGSLPTIVRRFEGKFFLDTVALNAEQLRRSGVRSDALYANYSVCTICSHNYCSYRKNKTHLRQITAASLY